MASLFNEVYSVDSAGFEKKKFLKGVFTTTRSTLWLPRGVVYITLLQMDFFIVRERKKLAPICSKSLDEQEYIYFTC